MGAGWHVVSFFLHHRRVMSHLEGYLSREMSRHIAYYLYTVNHRKWQDGHVSGVKFCVCVYYFFTHTCRSCVSRVFISFRCQ